MKPNFLLSLTCFLVGHGLVFHQVCSVSAFQVSSQPRQYPSALIQGRPILNQQGSRQQQSHLATITQRQSSSFLLATSSEPASDVPKLDINALGKYAAAIATQMTIFYGLFTGVDYLVHLANIQVPFAVNCVVFWFVALKSRVFNPLNNSRPKPDQNLEIAGTEQKRNMPTWTPPGVVFPIMWIFIIGPIRAATTAMVYSVTGSYATLAILSLMLHLSIGDCWNSINNVERRYGASVIGVLLVWLSNAHAAYQYYQVSPAAGQLLCVPLVWLTVASALIIRTWQLNPDPATGQPYPLYPVEGQGKTEFIWFQ